MIPQDFNNNELSEDTQEILNDLQNQVDIQIDFSAEVVKAKALWLNKNSGEPRYNAFREIRVKLEQGSNCEGVCTYCEQNIASDVEHVKPKSYFPGSCFQWENYVAACQTCNTDHKSNHCYIFNENDDLIRLSKGDEPASQDVAFIDPRIENPSDFMFLNLKSFRFKPFKESDIGSRNFWKADRTIAILKLNERPYLKLARESAYDYFCETLNRCALISESATLDQLRLVLVPREQRIDFNRDLEVVKVELLEAQRDSIRKRHHPTVWLEMKRQRKIDKDLLDLFERIPAALDW